MKCPVCHVPLQISERQGIEIDYCPQCRGVWLDRGELDKVIERTVSAMSNRIVAAQYPYDPNRHDEKGNGGHHHHDPHRKRSFLHDLFD